MGLRNGRARDSEGNSFAHRAAARARIAQDGACVRHARPRRTLKRVPCSQPRPRVDAVRVIKRLCLAAVVIALLAALAPPVSALECEGTPLDGGCLFTVTGGDTLDPDDGFAVTNAYDVPLWDFVQARDLDALGYPISQRWTDGPFTLQAFQKVILQWHPGKRQMHYFNTLDALANRYPEIELPFVPAHQVLPADHGADFATVTRNHLAILEQNAAIKARFLSEPDWLNLYGLPIRYEERDVDGNPQGVQLLRTQRTVFVIWNVPAPGTTIGRVLLQNLPDQVKKLSNVIIPDRVKQPVRELAPDIAAAIHSLPWATDGVSPFEQDVIQRLETIDRLSEPLFWYLIRDMHLPWTKEIIRKPIQSPPTAATVVGLDLVFQIASIPWIQDGLTESERLPFRILSDSAFIWPAYVEVLLQRAWLRDGVSQDEARVLDRTFNTLYANTLFPGNPRKIGQIAAELVAMPYMDTIEGFEPQVLHSLSLVYRHDSDASVSLDVFERIVSYLASKGGVTDEHALTLQIHGKDRKYIDSITDIYDPRQFDQYLVDPASRGITIERRWISLPLAGSTELIIVRDGPASAQTMDVFEQSVRVVENLMGVRYPTNVVILYITDRLFTSANLPGIVFHGTSFPTGEIPIGIKSIFIHELAHHYWTGATTWIVEGGATFMEIRSGYIDASRLETMRRSCSVKRLADVPYGLGVRSICPYALGASLFFDLYNALGNDTFHLRFKELYQIISSIDSGYHRIIHGDLWINVPGSHDYCDYCGGVDPSFYHVRLAFVDESDPATAAMANHIISHWYYGTTE